MSETPFKKIISRMKQFHSGRRRGVSEVVGFIMIISILVLAMSFFQTQIVPEYVLDTEIKHEISTQQDTQQLRQSIISVSADGNPRTVDMKLGTRYGSTLSPFVYPPPATGTLISNDPAFNVRIQNAEGLGGSSNYWRGGEKQYETDIIKYTPDYNQYDQSPKVYHENTLNYNEYDRSGTRIMTTDQSFVDGNSIQLTLLTGDLSTTRVSTTSVEVQGKSAPSNTISVEATEGEVIQIYLPTRLTADEWRELLADEDAVIDIEETTAPNDNGVREMRFAFDPDRTYELKISKVHLSTQLKTTSVERTDPAYIAWEGSDQVIVREGSRVPVDAQVRDKYNNPVQGVQVNATATDSSGDCFGDFQSGTSRCDGYLQPGQQTSDNQGRVRFVYEAPEVEQDEEISFELDFDE